MLVGLAVYQQQIGLDVAFPVVCPIARKAMVFILGRQLFIKRQQSDNLRQQLAQFSGIAPVARACNPA